jgi:hypothetical protein
VLMIIDIFSRVVDPIPSTLFDGSDGEGRKTRKGYTGEARSCRVAFQMGAADCQSFRRIAEMVVYLSCFKACSSTPARAAARQGMQGGADQRRRGEPRTPQHQKEVALARIAAGGRCGGAGSWGVGMGALGIARARGCAPRGLQEGGRQRRRAAPQGCRVGPALQHQSSRRVHPYRRSRASLCFCWSPGFSSDPRRRHPRALSSRRDMTWSAGHLASVARGDQTPEPRTAGRPQSVSPILVLCTLCSQIEQERPEQYLFCGLNFISFVTAIFLCFYCTVSRSV